MRYAERRLAGNRGNAPRYTADATRRILRILDLRPPEGYGRWTGPLIAKALGDVDPRFRGDKRSACLARAPSTEDRPRRAQKAGSESNDPEFAAKAAEVVGLYMAPPENAIVISVDEKPSIQALERAKAI